MARQKDMAFKSMYKPKALRPQEENPRKWWAMFLRVCSLGLIGKKREAE